MEKIRKSFSGTVLKAQPLSIPPFWLSGLILNRVSCCQTKPVHPVNNVNLTIWGATWAGHISYHQCMYGLSNELNMGPRSRTWSLGWRDTLPQHTLHANYLLGFFVQVISEQQRGFFPSSGGWALWRFLIWHPPDRAGLETLELFAQSLCSSSHCRLGWGWEAACLGIRCGPKWLQGISRQMDTFIIWTTGGDPLFNWSVSFWAQVTLDPTKKRPLPRQLTNYLYIVCIGIFLCFEASAWQDHLLPCAAWIRRDSWQLPAGFLTAIRALIDLPQAILSHLLFKQKSTPGFIGFWCRGLSVPLIILTDDALVHQEHLHIFSCSAVAFWMQGAAHSIQFKKHLPLKSMYLFMAVSLVPIGHVQSRKQDAARRGRQIFNPIKTQ